MSLTLRERAPAALARVSSSLWGVAATAVGYVVVLFGVLAMHGFLPGLSQPMVQTIGDSSAIQCLHDAGWGALRARCDAVGLPFGMTYLLGMPETMLGWLISWLPGVDAWAAHQITSALLDAVALGGGYLLLRRWSVPRVIALVAPAVYQVSPSLLGINGFSFTFTGYTFLPLYLYLFLCGIDRFAPGRRRWPGVAYLGGLAFLMVFTDGYSYATGLLLIGCVLIWWLIRDGTSRTAKIAAVATFAAANLLAVGAYSAYINAPPDPHARIGQFRYFGLDLVTLFIPQPRLIWPRHIGYHPPVLSLYGDGGNYLFNYMGFVMLGIVAWFVLSRRLRRQPASQQRELFPLLVAAMIALVLSFGPGLKIKNEVDPAIPVGDVPASQTRFGLPTAFLYRHVAPFDVMRATFRWSIGFRFVLIFAAAYALSLIWKSGHRGIAAALLLVSSVEVLPAPGTLVNTGRAYAREVALVRSQALGEFDRLTTPGDRMLLLPASNDFLAVAMAPAAHVRVYNAGGDKNFSAARASWPTDVLVAVNAIYKPAGQGDRIAAVLHNDADAVAICYFSMHTGGTTWPAPDPNQAVLRQEVAVLASDQRFSVRQGTLMAIVRLRS
jgi:hypothetical protein